MPNASRGSIHTGLVSNQWVCVFLKEDAYANPAFFYHHVNFHVEANSANSALTRLRLEDSPDGITWTLRYLIPNLLPPGGHQDISYYHVQRWVRLLAYTPGSGSLDLSMIIPEAQVLPRYLDTRPTCQSFCEVDCETGDETVYAACTGACELTCELGCESQCEASSCQLPVETG